MDQKSCCALTLVASRILIKGEAVLQLVFLFVWGLTTLRGVWHSLLQPWTVGKNMLTSWCGGSWKSRHRRPQGLKVFLAAVQKYMYNVWLGISASNGVFTQHGFHMTMFMPHIIYVYIWQPYIYMTWRVAAARRSWSSLSSRPYGLWIACQKSWTFRTFGARVYHL